MSMAARTGRPAVWSGDDVAAQAWGRRIHVHGRARAVHGRHPGTALRSQPRFGKKEKNATPRVDVSQHLRVRVYGATQIHP